MKSIRFFIILLLIVCIASVSSADTTATLARGVLEKYQSVQTYHARWSPVVDDPNSHSIWEAAFERKTGKVLFCIRGSQTNKKHSSQILLLVVDGVDMHGALDAGGGIQQYSKPIPDPNQLTYRDVRKAIPMLYPFDLPLIFAEHPFMEIIQSQVKETKTLTTDSDFYPGFAIFPEWEVETFAEYQIDPNTLLIRAFRFNRPDSTTTPIAFKNTFIQIDKKISADLFDFEKQLASYTEQIQTRKEK